MGNDSSILRGAEFVLPGHPDKLADAIADAIVKEAARRHAGARVAVEVALNRNVVFIDGRVNCPGADEIDFRSLARGVFARVGYGREFGPEPRRLKVRTDLCLNSLPPEEARLRRIADDQVISVGYACCTPGTGMLPVEQALAKRLANGLDRLRRANQALRLGPDGKVLVLLREQESEQGAPRRWTLERITASVQHQASWDSLSTRRAIRDCLLAEADGLAGVVPGLSVAEGLILNINPAGDFIEGGPRADNGLSGKKLVMDAYGPRVPIGGGATAGKDRWRADVRGRALSRAMAVRQVLRHGWQECTVTLAISPGDRQFTTAAVEGKKVGGVVFPVQSVA